MPEPGWGTRVRAGSPATVDITGPMTEILMGPTAFTWLGPVFELFSPYTTNTADLCATDPPQPENWGWADLMAAITHQNDAFYVAKLKRMTAAYLWPAYCEYYPLDEEAYDPREPIWHSDQGFGPFATNGYDNGHRIIGAPSAPWLQGYMSVENVWFWTLHKQCVVAPTTLPQTFPGLHQLLPDGSNRVNIATGGWPVVVGRQSISLLTRNAVMAQDWEPGHMWGISPPASGEWVFALIAWRKASDIPVADPWPEPDTFPTEFQFTEQEKADLMHAAHGWNANRTDMVFTRTAVSENWVTIRENRELLRALLAGNVDPGFTWQMGGQWTPGVGGGEVAIPETASGMALYVNVPNGLARAGHTPTAFMRAGWYAVGNAHGWFPSEPIKHDGQLVMPFPQGATKVGVTYNPGTSGFVIWLNRVAST